MWSQGRIPRLDCKNDGNLHPMVIVSFLTDTQYLQSPPPHAVAFLQSYHKLVNANQLPLGHLVHTKQKRTIPKTPDAKLDDGLLRLIAFGRRPFPCEVKLL